MTNRAIYTVLKTIGMDPLLAFDLAYIKYGDNTDNGYTGKMKWNTIVNKELPIWLFIKQELKSNEFK